MNPNYQNNSDADYENNFNEWRQDQINEEIDRDERYSLNLARKRALAVARHRAKKAGIALAQKLNHTIAQGHATSAFLGAAFLALFKDLLLDLIGLIPYIGWFLTLVIGIGISACLLYFLWGKGYFLRIRIRLFWFILGCFIDNLPAFSVLPITTLQVLYAWHIVRGRAKKAEAKLEVISTLTEKQIQKLNDNIAILDQEEVIDNQGELRHRTKIKAQLLALNEKKQKLDALREKKGYANVNLHTGAFQRKYRFNDDII